MNILIELLNGFASDISPIYVYVSILLTIFCSYQLISFGLKDSVKKNNMFIRDYHAIQVRLLPLQASFCENTDIRDWITKKTKRMASPDDDTDHTSFSFFNNVFKLRGGQLCKIIYSLSLKNTVLLG